jgi:UDP-N-acetylglucosamine 2-epimerase (non-hydrolysing)
VVIGTRPGIVKFSPVVKELQKHNLNFVLIHSGQHYSYEMDKVFFEELDLPEPKYKLSEVAGTKYHGEQTAKMLIGIEKALLEERPMVTLVGGDANTNLSGALAARKLQLVLGHIEAGLRSYDWRMPEEHNRVLIDHISDLLFATTDLAKRNLEKDNVKGRVYVTGNTIVDALRENVEIAKDKSTLLDKLKVRPGEYLLATIHREETVDYEETLSNVLAGLRMTAQQSRFPIVLPLHPRTRLRLEQFRLANVLNNHREFIVTNPVGYFDFLMLLSNAGLVLTDSGGVQEESCILKVPCVTLRENTERPETVQVGANVIAGTNPNDIVKYANVMSRIKRNWSNPFGEYPSRKIAQIVSSELRGN